MRCDTMIHVLHLFAFVANNVSPSSFILKRMDEANQTAIHEIMEQQMVSVAKAGIVTTLNARAAVLAAVNPLYGRYNRGKSLSENDNLPNLLVSRFDLMFLILDVADAERDVALARNVIFASRSPR